MDVFPQEVLRAQAPLQASLQVLQELGDQLKQQVDTSAASALQSDHISLTHRLAAVEHALSRQLTTLQVGNPQCQSSISELADSSHRPLSPTTLIREQPMTVWLEVVLHSFFLLHARLEFKTMRSLMDSWIHWETG